MPRFAVALLLVAGCVFDTNYDHARITCSDGKCPSGFTCSAAKVCVTPGDAGTNTDATDAHISALTCSDPGTAAGAKSGATTNRSNTVSSLCGGAVYNGPDAVYTVDGPGQVTVTIAGNYAVSAYVLSQCTAAPATPSCETNTAAQPGNPLTIDLTAGKHFVVVDGINASLSGTYTLTITQ